MEEKYTIGQLAKICEVGVETIRFYERKKILEQPLKKAAGVRYYEPIYIEKIRFVKKAQKVGFTLAEVKELLQLKFSSQVDCGPVKRKTQIKIKEIESKIEDLKKILKALKTFESRCNEKETAGKCSIFDGLRSL